MEIVTDYFDATYCINLNSRTDKWKECLSEFKKHGLYVWHFPAVDGDKIKYDGPLKKGVIGCVMSHRNVIQEAKDYESEIVLIFEDDVAFDKDLNNKFNEWYTEVPDDWDMLYLGGNHNVKEITKCSDHLMRCTNTQTTHAYAVKHTVYDMILERLKNIDLDIDVIYTEIQKKCNAYCFTPRLAWQRPGISDIWKQHVNYSFLKDDDGCHKAMK